MNLVKILSDLIILLKVFGTKIIMNISRITANLCSKVIKLFVKLNILIKALITLIIEKFSLKTLSENKREILFLTKFVKLIALLILFYQIISVTISYLEFEIVIDM